MNWSLMKISIISNKKKMKKIMAYCKAPLDKVKGLRI